MGPADQLILVCLFGFMIILSSNCDRNVIRLQDVSVTSCVFTGLNITDKYLTKVPPAESYPLLYDYQLLLKTHNTTTYVTRTSQKLEVLIADRKLIGQNLTCYYVRGELQITKPDICDRECNIAGTKRCFMTLIAGIIFGAVSLLRFM